MFNAQPTAVAEIHIACCWDVKRPRNKHRILSRCSTFPKIDSVTESTALALTTTKTCSVAGGYGKLLTFLIFFFLLLFCFSFCARVSMCVRVFGGGGGVGGKSSCFFATARFK